MYRTLFEIYIYKCLITVTSDIFIVDAIFGFFRLALGDRVMTCSVFAAVNRKFLGRRVFSANIK